MALAGGSLIKYGSKLSTSALNVSVYERFMKLVKISFAVNNKIFGIE